MIVVCSILRMGKPTDNDEEWDGLGMGGLLDARFLDDD
jgi:hypothetical protein